MQFGVADNASNPPASSFDNPPSGAGIPDLGAPVVPTDTNRVCSAYEVPDCKDGEELTTLTNDNGCSYPVCQGHFVLASCPVFYAPDSCQDDEEVVLEADSNGCGVPRCKKVTQLCPDYRSTICGDDEKVVYQPDVNGCARPSCETIDSNLICEPIIGACADGLEASFNIEANGCITRTCKKEEFTCPTYHPLPPCGDQQVIDVGMDAEGCEMLTCKTIEPLLCPEQPDEPVCGEGEQLALELDENRCGKSVCEPINCPAKPLLKCGPGTQRVTKYNQETNCSEFSCEIKCANHQRPICDPGYELVFKNDRNGCDYPSCEKIQCEPLDTGLTCGENEKVVTLKDENQCPINRCRSLRQKLVVESISKSRNRETAHIEEGLTYDEALNNCRAHFEKTPHRALECFWSKDLIEKRIPKKKSQIIVINLLGEKRSLPIGDGDISKMRAFELCTNFSKTSQRDYQCLWGQFLIDERSTAADQPKATLEITRVFRTGKTSVVQTEPDRTEAAAALMCRQYLKDREDRSFVCSWDGKEIDKQAPKRLFEITVTSEREGSKVVNSNKLETEVKAYEDCQQYKKDHPNKAFYCMWNHVEFDDHVPEVSDPNPPGVEETGTLRVFVDNYAYDEPFISTISPSVSRSEAMRICESNPYVHSPENNDYWCKWKKETIKSLIGTHAIRVETETLTPQGLVISSTSPVNGNVTDFRKIMSDVIEKNQDKHLLRFHIGGYYREYTKANVKLMRVHTVSKTGKRTKILESDNRIFGWAHLNCVRTAEKYPKAHVTCRVEFEDSKFKPMKFYDKAPTARTTVFRLNDQGERVIIDRWQDVTRAKAFQDCEALYEERNQRQTICEWWGIEIFNKSK